MSKNEKIGENVEENVEETLNYSTETDNKEEKEEDLNYSTETDNKEEKEEREKQKRREEEEKRTREVFNRFRPTIQADENSIMVNRVAVPKEIAENGENTEELARIIRVSAVYNSANDLEKMAQDKKEKNNKKQFKNVLLTAVTGLALFYMADKVPMGADAALSGVTASIAWSWKFISNHCSAKKSEKIADDLHVDYQNTDSNITKVQLFQEHVANGDFKKADQIADENEWYKVLDSKTLADSESKVKQKVVEWKKDKKEEEKRYERINKRKAKQKPKSEQQSVGQKIKNKLKQETVKYNRTTKVRNIWDT